MKCHLPLFSLAVAFSALSSSVVAATAPLTDKSGYSLSNPTPASALRELTTDRPDATESPFTVDAGHVQLEMSFASFTRNRLDGDRSRQWEVAPFNIRLGVTNNFEAGVFLSPYLRQVDEPRFGAREKHSGFGDVVLRVKNNFWGNDGGPSAFGVIVDLKLPTATAGFGNDAVEGAVIFPVSHELPGGWDFGAMTGGEARHRAGGGTRLVWINTATVGHDLGSNLGVYFELTSEAGDGAHVATFDAGLSFKLNADTQLDAGVNLGISRTADDAQFFAGLSRRF